MKKITSIILASLLALSATASAFATEVPGSEDKEITATYYEPAPDSVYEVDIIWGSMEFDYNSGLKRVWVPEKLEYYYDQYTEPTWTPSDENGDIVTVNNHSNNIVEINVDYTKDAENGVDGTLTNDNYILQSAEGTAVEDAPSASTQLTLSTESMPADFKEGSTNVAVGYLTVIIYCNPYSVDATSMSAEDLKTELSSVLEQGSTKLDITLAEDAPTEMFTAIRRALVDAENVEDGSIGLTLAGVTAIPDHNRTTAGPSIFGEITLDENNNSLDRKEYVNELVSISLPDVLTIGDYAFNNCDFLSTVELPKATTIGRFAFNNCDALTTVKLPEATTIDYYAFYYCDLLTTVEAPKATTIGNSAFNTCRNLTTVKLPEATTIGSAAFVSCKNLKTIELPKVTSVGSYAFRYSALTTVELPEATTIDGEAFCGCKSLTTVKLPKATSIGNHVFYSCTALTSVELPEVTTIGNNAFASCSYLTSVNLPKVTSVGDMAFSLTALTSLTLTTEEDIYIHEDALGYPETFSTSINLVLNSNKQDAVTDGNVWNGFTFNSITFAD